MRTNGCFLPLFIVMVIGILTGACRSIDAGGGDSTRPNVVLIMTDDQGYGDLSFHGNPILKTPNLDRLAEQSIRLTDFHVAPACTPTRGQLMTGLDALRNGASSPHGQRTLLKRGLTTMADIFRANGYRTAMYGKWHLGGNHAPYRPHERGFQDAVWFLRGGVQSHPNYWNSDLMDDPYLHNGVYEPYKGYATDLWFELGEAFIRQAKADREPFFLYLPLNAPHAPLLVQNRYREPYKHLDNKETATFFGMIAGVDDRMGRFMRFLEAEGLRDDTILIFLTDNGTAYGEKVFNAGMRGKKASLYEGGHRVPFFISWPEGNLRPPGPADALTEVQDVLPTLIDLAGLSVPPALRFDGLSLAPLLRNQPQPELEQRLLVAQMLDAKGQGAVLWNKWRLVDNALYDIQADPGQQTDVAALHPEVVRRMKNEYESWWASVEPELVLERYGLGAEKVMLTAYDWWYGDRVYNWPHLRRGDRSNGRYEVVVEDSGEYTFRLRRWPAEADAGIRKGVPQFIPFDSFMSDDPKIDNFPEGKALDIRNARVRIGGQEQEKTVGDEDKEVSFTFRLPEGPTDLQTWFVTADGEEFGAYYVYVEKSR